MQSPTDDEMLPSASVPLRRTRFSEPGRRRSRLEVGTTSREPRAANRAREPRTSQERSPFPPPRLESRLPHDAVRHLHQIDDRYIDISQYRTEQNDQNPPSDTYRRDRAVPKGFLSGARDPFPPPETE